MTTLHKAANRVKSRARRAVSDSDKAARRAAILEAAEQQLRKVGVEGFSMEVLARALGVARGTLYRYFATREEVLLQLYLDQRTRFAAALVASVRPGISHREFVACWYTHATADPLFLMLQARLGSVIEHNISTSRLIEAKREMQAGLNEAAEPIGACLELDAERARHLIVALAALLLGATEIDNSPRLAGMPADVEAAMALYRCRDVFTDNALLILQGLTARRD